MPALTPRLLALSALLLAGAASAQQSTTLSTTYKCVDAQGRTTFTNTGDSGGCKKLGSIDALGTSLPAPDRAPAPAVSKGDRPAPKTGDRQRILDDEIRTKEAELATLQKDYNGGQPERQGGEKNNQRYLDRIEHMKSEMVRLENDLNSLRAAAGRSSQ